MKTGEHEYSTAELEHLGVPTTIPLASDGKYCEKCGGSMRPSIISIYQEGFDPVTGKPYYTGRMRATCTKGDSTYTCSIRTDPECERWVGYGLPSCFIATAAYGTNFNSDIDVLRKFRDNHLRTNSIGRLFVYQYYRHSPPIADWIRYKSWARLTVRILLYPIVKLLQVKVKENVNSK